ncbi:MAG: hypothetical protein ABL898_11740 [Hyphomicrobiaceae bacterium]|nr:hypothetical protein [Hyphomicrobiaceae bacterium]
MSTQFINADELAADPVVKHRYAGFLGFLKAFASAVSEGTRAHDDYRALTRNGVSHDKAVRQVLNHNYDAR